MRMLLYQLGRTAGNIFGRKISLIASLLSLLLLFFMLTIVIIAYLTGERYFQSLISEISMEVYIDDSLDETETDQLVSYAKNILGVSGLSFISKDSARDKLFTMMGADLLDGFDENPLPRSMILSFNPKFLTSDYLEHVIEEVMSKNGVTEIYYPNDWLRKSENSRALVLKAAIFFGITAVLAILFNLLHIIRLSVRYFQDETKQFRLLGAGKIFLSIPYIIEGFFFALFSSVMSWLIAIYLLRRFSFESFIIVIPQQTEIIYFCAGATLIGMLVGLITVRRVL